MVVLALRAPSSHFVNEQRGTIRHVLFLSLCWAEDAMPMVLDAAAAQGRSRACVWVQYSAMLTWEFTRTPFEAYEL